MRLIYLIFIFLVTGCQVEEQMQSSQDIVPAKLNESSVLGEQDKEIASQQNPADSGDFKETSRVINALYDDKLKIGDERYTDLKRKLDNYESQGIDVKELRMKLEALKISEIQDSSHNEENDNSSRRSSPEFPSDSERNRLPDCGLNFELPPVGLDNVYEISPLGNIGPPGHTFPTEHSFIHLSATGTINTMYELQAPQDIFILHVREQKEATQDPIDYTIYFALCKDIYGYFNHVKSVSSVISNMTMNEECLAFNQENVCAKNTFTKVRMGEILGKVGGIQGNFDFGLMDLSKKNQFANPSRYGARSLYIQCPYDYYPENLRQKFFDLIRRNDEGQCGIVAQDLPGTIKGNWFYGDARADIGTDWNRHLAFVQDNEEPEKSIVSIGGTLSEPKKIIFIPEDTGTLNLRFDKVTSNGNIYCYSDGSSKVIVQLIKSDELKIEHKTGPCSGTEQFAKPYFYSR